MAYTFRHLNDPYQSGFVVKLSKRCGRKNCHCYTKNERHAAYGLKYPHYDEFGKLTQKMKYLKRSAVQSVARRLAIRKSYNLWHRFPDELLHEVVDKFSCVSNEEVFFQAYITAKHPRIYQELVNN